METAIEQLRKLVIEGKESIPNRGVRTFTLLQELTFIENRKQVNYFLAMHRYVKELTSMPDALIGPGRRWMTASHVCHALGITNICLGSISLTPIDYWGDEDSDTTMDIEVDEDTYDWAYFKATEVFGYDNVARTSEIVCFPCYAKERHPRRVSINKRIDDYGRTEMHDRARIHETRFCPH